MTENREASDNLQPIAEILGEISYASKMLLDRLDVCGVWAEDEDGKTVNIATVTSTMTVHGAKLNLGRGVADIRLRRDSTGLTIDYRSRGLPDEQDKDHRIIFTTDEPPTIDVFRGEGQRELTTEELGFLAHDLISLTLQD